MNAARLLGAAPSLIAVLAALAVPVLIVLEHRRKPMTFHFTDPDGDHLYVTPTTRYGAPAINLRTARGDKPCGAAVDIPVDQVEELIAGIRNTARQAAGIPPISPAATEPTACGPACAEAPGIRGLLEHVGIDTRGRDITVAGKLVDAAEPEEQRERPTPFECTRRNPCHACAVCWR